MKYLSHEHSLSAPQGQAKKFAVRAKASAAGVVNGRPTHRSLGRHKRSARQAAPGQPRPEKSGLSKIVVLALMIGAFVATVIFVVWVRIE
jgi:hypothetical protein